MAKIFIFGDSHTRALNEALGDYIPLNPDIEFYIHWLLKEKNGSVRGDLRYEDALDIAQGLGEEDLLVVSLLGTGHNIYGLLEHDIPFFLSLENKKNNEIKNRQLIPENLALDMFIGFCNKNKRIIELKARSRSKVIHLMTPPPKFDNDYIKSKTNRDRDKMVGEYDINPPGLRLQLWKVEMKALEMFCAQNSITLIPPPSSSITSEGFLDKKYWGGDATHANALYGQLVLKQLEELHSHSANPT